jgi:hypothetical protein
MVVPAQVLKEGAAKKPTIGLKGVSSMTAEVVPIEEES